MDLDVQYSLVLALGRAEQGAGGAIVNIASIVGETGNAGQTNYSASKGGMIAMTKSFALEGAARNIRFNAITPGFIDTDMTRALDEKQRDALMRDIPLGRLGGAAFLEGQLPPQVGRLDGLAGPIEGLGGLGDLLALQEELGGLPVLAEDRVVAFFRERLA